MNIRFFFLLASLFCSTSQAVTWGVQTTITNYYVEPGKRIVLTTLNNQNPAGCSSSQYLVVDPSLDTLSMVFATIVSAHASGSTVTLLYDGCDTNNAYPKITAVAVPKNW
jgi:hypothetical protein